MDVHGHGRRFVTTAVLSPLEVGALAYKWLVLTTAVIQRC